MRTLGEAFRSTFQRHEEWPRAALAGLGDQVSLNTPVGAIEQGELWLLDDGDGAALPTLLILTDDRLVAGQTAIGRGGLRWITLSSVKRLDAVDDTATGQRLHVELFLQGGLGVGVKCSDPFVETLVESLRGSAAGEPSSLGATPDPAEAVGLRDRHPPSGVPKPSTPAGHDTHLAHALGEVDDDPSKLDDLEAPAMREGTVPSLAPDDPPVTATPLDDEPVVLPTRNRGRAYDVGLEAERSLAASAATAVPLVSDRPRPNLVAPEPMAPEPTTPEVISAKALPTPDADAVAETVAAPTESLLPNPLAAPPSAESRPQFGGTSFVTAFDVPETVETEPGHDLPSVTVAPPTETVFQVEAAPSAAPTTEDVPQIEAPEGAPLGLEQAADGSWMSWPTDAPTLATPAGYGADEYDPAVDDFADLAAGATSFDGPEDDLPKPQPSMVGVTTANDGWWRTMPLWPDAIRSMTYLGGHPQLTKKRKNVIMFFRPDGIRTEASGFGSWKIELPWDQITGMNVESSDELIYHTNMRIDLSSAALTIQTDAGTLYFECRLRRPASVRSMLAPVLNSMGGSIGQG